MTAIQESPVESPVVVDNVEKLLTEIGSEEARKDKLDEEGEEEDVKKDQHDDAEFVTSDDFPETVVADLDESWLCENQHKKEEQVRATRATPSAIL